MSDYGHIVISSNMKDWDAQVIKFFTGSYFSHALLTVNVLDRLVALEATGKGTSAVPFDIGYESNDGEDYVMFSVNIPQEVKDVAISKCLDDLEKTYGYLELPWFAWRAVCKLFGKDIRSKDNWSQAGIICSEYASNYLKSCGLQDLFKDFGQGSISAQDVYEICKAHPEVFTEVKRKIRNPGDSRL